MVIFKFSYVFLIHLLLSIGIAESFSGGRQSNTLSFTSIRRRQQSSCYANFPLHTHSDQEPSVKKSRVVKSTPLLNLLSIDTFEDFTSTLKQHHSDIIVVRFHSPWCKLCASIAPSYHRLARRYPHATFINVSMTDSNPDLHKDLNIATVPFGHIYTQSKLVGEMRLTKKNWKLFETGVKHIVDGYCKLDDLRLMPSNAD